MTAQDIGTESNVDKSKRFKIADLSQSIYFAMNDAFLLGWDTESSENRSSQDQEDLKASLLQKQKINKKQEILKAQNKQVTLHSLMDFQLTDIKFSKELGEEGENLSLQAKSGSKILLFRHHFLIKEVLKRSRKRYSCRVYI